MRQRWRRRVCIPRHLVDVGVWPDCLEVERQLVQRGVHEERERGERARERRERERVGE